MVEKKSKRVQPTEPPETTEAAPDQDALHDLADEIAAAAGGIDAELQTLHSELEDANDRAMRIQAELENYRKRAARELQDERRYASLPLMRDLLPVWDNILRAIEAAEQNHDVTALLEGVKMVAQQFETVLAQHKCERIAAADQPFDPNLHEAILQQPSEEHPPGTVMMETQTGFQIHDRVVRPSQVIVSAASEPSDEETQPNE